MKFVLDEMKAGVRMRVLLYPDKQIIYTYLQIGCEVELIVSKNGEQAILCPDSTIKQLESYLSENNFLPIDTKNDYILYLNKECAEWEYHCPRYYNSLPSRQEQHQAYYQDGMATITGALAQMQCLTNIRLKKGTITDNTDIFSYLESQ